MIINRRDFVRGGVGALLLPSFAKAQSGGSCSVTPVGMCGPMAIKSLSVDGPRNTNNPPYNKLKGTMSFKVNNKSRQLNAYWNTGNRDRQCVELIGRYAWQLGFYEFASKALTKDDFGKSFPALGNGVDVARNFARFSNGGFTYVYNGAKSLPKAGAVVSIEKAIASPYGHVGILCNHDEPSKNTTKILVKVFEQNMKTATWSEVEFVKQKDGTWSGKFYIGGKANGGKGYAVMGWANPNG
jgi:hypothetical protein